MHGSFAANKQYAHTQKSLARHPRGIEELAIFFLIDTYLSQSDWSEQTKYYAVQ